ncbi:MAG: Ig-like domain-containing protein, partial [Thermoplasmata archaeon]|nr:Ig-like domain-containing protein [Thermoplasmata archaeon]
IVFNYNNYSDQYWLLGHKGSVNDISWDVQNTLISGASDPNAKVWSTAAKAETANLGMHRNSVYAVDRIASGTRIATGGGNSLEKGRSESQIYCAVSTDGGMNFDEPVVISEILSGMKHSPKVAMDGNDVISVVWYDDRNYLDDVYFSNSTDMGVSFSDDIPVSVTAGKVENLPTIAVERDTGTVHLAWQKETGGDYMNPIHDIHYANSSDGFSRVLLIDPNTAVQQTPDITATPDGIQVYITWIDSRLGGYQVFLYNSSDGGMTFSGHDVVNDEDTQSKYSPTVGVNKYGDLAVVWHDYRDAGVNIYYSGNVLADTTAPIIISVTPEDGATNVSIFKPIIIEFSEPMDKTSVEEAFTLTIDTQVFTADDFVISWSGYGDEIRLTPGTPMQYNSAYTAELDTGPLDISGNVMASGLTWDFSTGSDWDPPVIQEQLTIEVSGLTFTITTNDTFDVNYDEAATIYAEIKDYNGEVDEARIYYMGVGSTSYSNMLVMEKIGGPEDDDYSATIPAQNSLGNVSFYIWASDIRDNAVNTTPYHYSVKDIMSPEIELSEITEWPVHSLIPIEAHVTDFSSLDSIQLAYKRATDLIFTVVNMSYSLTTGNYSAQIPEQTSIGVLEFDVTAVDGSGNENRTDTVMVDIIDVNKPVIELYEPLNQEDKSISIVAEVTDDIAVLEVSLYFKAVGGDLWVKRTMALQSGNEYAYTIPAQTRSGKIYYYVNATDTSGNTASTLDDIQDFAHVWSVTGTETPWLAYIIPIIILIAAIVLAWVLKNRRNGKPDTEEDDGEGNGKSEVEPRDETDMQKTGEDMNKKDEPGIPEQKDGEPEIESVDTNEDR